MNKPNKIFVRDFGNSLCKVWTYDKGKKKGDVDVEYINKDKLIEWAKKELEMRRNTGDDYFYPAIVVLGDLIAKLNSL